MGWRNLLKSIKSEGRVFFRKNPIKNEHNKVKFWTNKICPKMEFNPPPHPRRLQLGIEKYSNHHTST